MEIDREITPGTSATREKLEVAHILFMDIVGYAKLPMEQQAAIVNELQAIVHDTADFRESNVRGDLLCLPRGDGMALVFFRDALSPLRCAMEIARELKTRPHIRLRMGMNTGPVYLVRDINDDPDVSGAGIVTAQRVMDCGDEGHILISSTVAEHITKLTAWSPYVHDLGLCEVKHGQQVHLFNFYTRDVGNSTSPRKVMAGYAAIVERMRTPKPKHVPSRFYAVRDGVMIVFWVCFVGGGLGAGLYAISPTVRDGVRGLFQRPEAAPARRQTGSGEAAPRGVGQTVDPRGIMGRGASDTGDGAGSDTSKGEHKSGRNPRPDPSINLDSNESQAAAHFVPPTLEVESAATGASLHGSEAGAEPAADPQENPPETTVHTINVTVRTHRDGEQSRSVKVTYHDDRGTGEMFSRDLPEDEAFSTPVEVYGKSVWVGVYYNGKLVLSRQYIIPDR
jgi:class 3 adenylate cyclase